MLTNLDKKFMSWLIVFVKRFFESKRFLEKMNVTKHRIKASNLSVKFQHTKFIKDLNSNFNKGFTCKVLLKWELSRNLCK